ncbi:MAG: cytochrome c [Hyphomicrobiales bacterium]|nr:cytochrome c [Hyphomicrobiales bacterium]
MKTTALTLGALAFAMGLGLSPAATQADDEGAIKHRQAVMKAVGGNMGAMVAILKGQVGFMEDMPLHARAMNDLAQISARIFPQGSDFGETDAKEAIWEKPDAFKQRVQAFQDAAAALTKVAGSGDKGAIGGAIGNLGKSCKGCHDDFRKEHRH